MYNMCLYPRLIRNPKYTPNKKNGGFVPIPSDNRARFVAVGCGECIECKKKKSREWRIRMLEEFKENRKCSFVTLTFSEESLLKYRTEAQKELDDQFKCDIYQTDNVAAKIAIRHMLERYRKTHGKSIRHWFITERGHRGTRRVHIHGLIWSEFSQAGRGNSTCHDLTDLWKNGWTYNGDYVGERTITYISKYITKHDEENRGFVGKICTSAGIGRHYIEKGNGWRNTYRGKETTETYKMPNGKEIGLPMYYRNKIYTDRQREKLWMNLLDKEQRFVLGAKIDISLDNEWRYESAVQMAREVSKNAGYKEPEWANEEYRKKYNQDRILLSRNKSVILQYNSKAFEDGKKETDRSSGSQNENVGLGHKTKNGRNDLYSSGRLFANKSLCNGKEPNGGLRNETERYRSINRWQSNREMADHMDWSKSKDNNINSNLSYVDDTDMGKKEEKQYKIPRLRNLERRYEQCNEISENKDVIQWNGLPELFNRRRGRQNNSTGYDKSTYECIDVDTGEVFAGGIKDKTYKTLYYEKRSRKITKPDGTKSKIWKTIRYVQRMENRQLELF